ncbi:MULTISPECIES: hypothetical protein [unclassified Pseudomonas]
MLSRLFQRPAPQKQPLFAPTSLQLSEAKATRTRWTSFPKIAT